MDGNIEKRLGRIEQFLATNHDRLGRVESMLAYIMERHPEVVTKTPGKDEARRLHELGLDVWKTVEHKTNWFELWHKGFNEILKKRLDAQAQQGADNGKEDEKVH